MKKLLSIFIIFFLKLGARKEKIKPAVFNSIINKTPISYKANRMIGGKAPSNYLASIQAHKQVGLNDPAMNTILSSHSIDPASLRADDFNKFYERRQESFLEIVERAMGKTIDRGVSTDSNDDMESEAQMMEEYL